MKLETIHFGTLKYFWYLLPILFIVFIILILKFKRKQAVINTLTNKANAKNIILNFSKPKNILKLVLSFIGFFFLFLALLSPQWNKTEENVKQKGRDILIALDVSRSMLAKDLFPNRLESAKTKIKSLLKLIKSDRVGLILFSGTAFVQCPLTRDLTAFYMFLDQVDVESISNGTTAIDQAVKIALDSFKSDQSRKNKLLVIFTDGEDFSSNLAGIKKQAQEENLHIFSIGVATPEGAPIPLYNENGKQIGNQLDNKGAIVMSRLNEGVLAALSQESGAFYSKITKTNDDLKLILNKIKEFESEQFDTRKICKFHEQYPYFVAVSFICFALEWIL